MACMPGKITTGRQQILDKLQIVHFEGMLGENKFILLGPKTDIKENIFFVNLIIL